MSFTVPKQLKSCLLRDFVQDDIEVLADIEYDSDVKKYIGLPELPRAEWVRSNSADLLRGWAVEVDQALAGRASISRPKDSVVPGILELQIVIAKPFWGRQLGRQVAAALIQYAFSDQRTVEVVAQSHPENRASRQLLKAFGFVDAGIRNNNERLDFKLDRHTYNATIHCPPD